MDCVKQIWYLSPMRAAKVQASLRIRAVSPEPSLLAHTSSESRGTFRKKARSLTLLNGWACAVKICHDGMLEDTNSLDAAHMFLWRTDENCPSVIIKYLLICSADSSRHCLISSITVRLQSLGLRVAILKSLGSDILIGPNINIPTIFLILL